MDPSGVAQRWLDGWMDGAARSRSISISLIARLQDCKIARHFQVFIVSIFFCDWNGALETCGTMPISCVLNESSSFLSLTLTSNIHSFSHSFSIQMDKGNVMSMMS